MNLYKDTHRHHEGENADLTHTNAQRTPGFLCAVVSQGNAPVKNMCQVKTMLLSYITSPPPFNAWCEPGRGGSGGGSTRNLTFCQTNLFISAALINESEKITGRKLQLISVKYEWNLLPFTIHSKKFFFIIIILWKRDEWLTKRKCHVRCAQTVRRHLPKLCRVALVAAIQDNW